MKIEKLTQSKKVPDRWYMELSNGETIKVNIAIIADFGLYIGKELSDEEYEDISGASAAAGTKARALRILGARQLSKKEMTEKLLKKGETEENTADAVDFLERVGVLNDAEYAAAIVRHYSAKGYGERRVRDELFRRGIPREFWEDALSELPEGNDALDRIIASKVHDNMDQKEIKKLTDMLIRRGFSWEEVKEAMERSRILEDF